MIALITGWGHRLGVVNSRNFYHHPDTKFVGVGVPLAVSREHWQQDDYIFTWPGLLQPDAGGLIGYHALDLTNPKEAATYDAVKNGGMFWSTGPDGTPAAAARRPWCRADYQTPTETRTERRRHIEELAYTVCPADRGIPPLTVAAVLPHQDPPAKIVAPVLYALWAIGELTHG